MGLSFGPADVEASVAYFCDTAEMKAAGEEAVPRLREALLKVKMLKG